MKKLLFIILVSLSYINLFSQQVLTIEKGELWYGGSVNEGYKMPFSDNYSNSLVNFIQGNQAAPVLISNKGRYIWSDSPFSYQVKGDELIIKESDVKIDLQKVGSSLKDAYIGVAKKYFPPKGGMPDSLLFKSPQYNTWIELIYNQNQDDILKYAHDIIDNGYPPGVLMIDDNWAPYYGKFEFRKDRFPNAKAMIDELHGMGFKVMLWVCPFVSPDSEVFRELHKQKLFLMSNNGNKDLEWDKASDPVLVNWWNGYSAVLDFSNPMAIDWYKSKLDHMIDFYGLDGFKLDAGDPEYYTNNVVSFVKGTSPNDHCELYGLFGLEYPLNEYRAMWKRAGEPLVERLRDKVHTWDDVQKLIPNMTAAGLIGYAFTCPDMIGGGDFSSFIGNENLDQDLIVRSAQCHALMPMMQFSVAPWRVLDEVHHNAVKKAVELRQKFVPIIMSLAENAAITGEPIIRHMEYVFPNQGFENCKDQFMLGYDILVAPVVTKNNSRVVSFPNGVWLGDDGKKYKGGKDVEFKVPLDELLWFKKVR